MDEFDFLPDLPLLIVVRVGARLAGEGDAEAARMDEVAMTALAPAINEAGALEVGDQFAEFPRHGSIKTILLGGASDFMPRNA